MIRIAARALRRPFMAAAFFLLLALALSAPNTHAAPRAARDPAGSISGVVTNGTHNGAPVASLRVTLRAIVLDSPHDAGSATTDVHGHFAFGNLDTSGETTYEVYAHYQGGFFVTAPVTFGGSAAAAQTTTLAIYDTTTDMAALRVSNLTVLISAVEKDKGLIPVGMFYTFANTGTRAIVGSLNPPAGAGMPQGIVRFALPANATNLTLGAGFADAQTMQIDTGFAATATIPPGFASFAFAFDLPYTGTSAALPLSALYPTDRLSLLAPPSYHVTAPGFATDTPITANGQQFQQLHVDNLAAGASKQVALSALPEAGVDPDLRFGQIVPIAAILGLLLALLLWFFAARGNLGALSRLATQPPSGRRGARRAPSQTQVQARAATRQRLLDALLDLDERHTGGAISDAAYDRRRAELRTELRGLLAGDLIAQPAGRTPHAPTPAGPEGDGTENAEDAEVRGGRGEKENSTAEETERTEEQAAGRTAGGRTGQANESESVGAQGVRPAETSGSVGASGGRPPAGVTARPATRSATPSPRRERGQGGEVSRPRRSRATAGGGR